MRDAGDGDDADLAVAGVALRAAPGASWSSSKPTWPQPADAGVTRRPRAVRLGRGRVDEQLAHRSSSAGPRGRARSRRARACTARLVGDLGDRHVPPALVARARRA